MLARAWAGAHACRARARRTPCACTLVQCGQAGAPIYTHAVTGLDTHASVRMQHMHAKG